MKYHTLSPEQIAKLESVGMVWSKNDEQWMTGYRAALDYYMQRGDLNVPATFKDANGYALGDWLRQQVEKYRAGKLDKSKIEKLNAIGMEWLFQKEKEWETHFKAAEKYFNEHGDLRVPTTYVDESGFALGLWLWRIKTGKTKTAVNSGNGDQKKRLISIGLAFNTNCQDGGYADKTTESLPTGSVVV